VIVYVESNFILELAFRQEDHLSCESLLQLAESGAIQLVLPAFCVGEPYGTLIRRARQRRDVHRKLKAELKELARSAPYAHAASNLDGLTGLLIEAGDDELNSLNNTLTRLLNTAQLIPIDRVVLQGALSAQNILGLSPQDAIVYASVRSSVIAATEAQCFLNKNSKDFLIPQIEEEFSAHNCKLLARFSDGLSYVDNEIATPPGKH
jgi:predicted nucleic acid-binding protein